MDDSEYLNREASVLIEEIQEAFRGVSRVGGVSWAESKVVDMRGSIIGDPLYHDRDRSWEELIDDPEWRSDPGVGGWAFVDPIGFRYYLPAAMVRGIRLGEAYGLPFWLSLRDGSEEYSLRKWSLIDEPQRIAVARFLIYMASVARERYDYAMISDEWREALDSAWAHPLPQLSDPDAEAPPQPPNKRPPRKKSSQRSS